MSDSNSTPMKHRRAHEFRTKVEALYRSGMTAKEIAADLGTSRVYVSRLLSKHGITAKDGGAAVARKEKAVLVAQKKDVDALHRFGCTFDELKAYKRTGVHVPYSAQRRSAERRGIPWAISLPDWVSVWEASGKMHLRGKGAGKYVMSRPGDVGAYEVSNVTIKLGSENNSEATAQWIGKPKKALVGVHLLYPNGPNPWMAKYKGKSLGVFKTAEEASYARNIFINEGRRCTTDCAM